MRPTLDKCGDTHTPEPAHPPETRSGRAGDKTPAHFMAFRAFIARRLPFFIAGAAGAAAFFIAFAMIRKRVSEISEKADKIFS